MPRATTRCLVAATPRSMKGPEELCRLGSRARTRSAACSWTLLHDVGRQEIQAGRLLGYTPAKMMIRLGLTSRGTKAAVRQVTASWSQEPAGVFAAVSRARYCPIKVMPCLDLSRTCRSCRICAGLCATAGSCTNSRSLHSVPCSAANRPKDIVLWLAKRAMYAARYSSLHINSAFMIMHACLLFNVTLPSVATVSKGAGPSQRLLRSSSTAGSSRRIPETPSNAVY